MAGRHRRDGRSRPDSAAQVGPENPTPVEGFWTGTLPRAEAAAELAGRLAPGLVGLTEDQARAAVEAEPGLSIRFLAPGTIITLEAVLGRITATTVDGLVRQVTVG